MENRENKIAYGEINLENPNEVSADMRIGRSGNSLVLKITEQARMLGVDYMDIVNVTIRKK